MVFKKFSSFLVDLEKVGKRVDSLENAMKSIIESVSKMLYDLQTVATTCALIIETLEDKGIELKSKSDSKFLH